MKYTNLNGKPKTCSITNMNVKQKGNLALLTTGFLFGASSPLAKLLSPYLSAFGVVGSRFLFALPFAVGTLFFSKEKLNVRQDNLGRLAFFAFIFPISVIFYTLALFYTKVSLAIFSFYIANLLSSLVLGKILHKERFDASKKIAFFLSFVAVVIFTKPFNSFIFDIGMVFGYVSGIIQTFASHYQKKYSNTINEKTLSLAQIIGGILVGLGIAFSIGDFGLFKLPLHGLGIAVIFGFVIYLINLLLIYGFKRADIGTGTILMSSELIFGPIMAYVLFSEVLGTSEMIGGLFALVATILVSRK